ncbi:hypothetical protein FNF31_06873 [Cafeteria roenbergensis]|uniref:Uncharacterized protein n=1 Tax=Cafeteria roenbergensis TaxID=33653 RepID=A0A5A8CDG3_CAFRO|nr:hypothetical protein FNF31_06873 [Cafeteria roenbergensis]
MVLHDSTGGARSVPVRPLSSAASETDSHPFSTDAKQGAAGHLPRESARRDAVGLALGTLSLSSVSPEVARARVELGQDHFQFIVEMAAAKGLRSDDNENIVELLGRLGTASIELAHCTDIDAVLQRARVTLAMPGVEAQLAKWHRLGHLQSVAGGFAEVMAKPSTIATVQDHARKLLLEAEEQAEKQAEKAKREAEEKAEKAKREAEEKAEKAKREAEEKGKRDSFVAAMNALVKYSSSYRQSGELADYDELQASKLAWKSLRTAQSDRRLSLFLGTQQRTELVSAVFEGVFDLAFREQRMTATNVKFLSGPKGSGKTTLVWKAAKAAVEAIPRSRVADVVVVKLDEQQESTLSDIPGIVNELRGKLHAEPPAIAEQLDKLRQCPAWKRLTSVFDGLQPTARRLVESFVHTERSDATWDPIAKMEQAEAIAFWQAVAQPVAKLLVTGFATVPVGTAPQSVSWALGASMLPLLNTDFKELSQQRGVVDDARVAADALVDQGVLRQSLDDKFGLSSNFMRLLSLRVLDETGSCGLHPRQVLAMLDATGASGEAMELLAAKGICETGPGAFLRQCMDSQPHLPTYQAAEDASSSISGWLNDLKSATVTAKGQDARPASETSADSAVGPSEAAKSIAVQLLPSLDLKASDGGQPLPLDKFFKEKPDRFGADAIAVVELGEKDGPKTRHIIRVQVKVSSDTDEQKALSTGGVATILQQMNDSFRDDGSSEPKTSLLQSVLTSQTEGLACIVVWNCLVTCKKTSLARDSSNWLKALRSASKDVWQLPTADALSRTARADRPTGLKADESKSLLGGLHPFKSEANGVPVYVVPVVADHEVMLDMWPARVKQFASATGIRNYSKPRP